jgi:CelD/BcsL family acetyltransferase involved in cellulose biosynthesis
VPRAVVLREEALPPLALLERQWRSLESAAPPSFFLSWHWIGTFLAALPVPARPSLLRGTADGHTVALALLGRRSERRRHGLIASRALYLNETGDPRFDLTIEHNGLLAAADYRQAAGDALIDWFAGDAAADELHIAGSPGPVCGEIVERRGLLRHQLTKPTYSVALARLAPEGELFPVLSANARQQLRRAMRHYERAGQLRLEAAATVDEAHRFFAAMKALHIATWTRRGQPHAFSCPFFERFHRLLIERSFAAGVIRMLRASAGETIVGYLYNFRFGDRVYAYQSGFAYDDASARPGAVAHALAIRDAARSGAAVYDFLAGHNRLKDSFATDRQTMLWQILQRPRLGFRLERLARTLKRRVLELRQHENPSSPRMQNDRPGPGRHSPVGCRHIATTTQ